jgi:hypothetical protein
MSESAWDSYVAVGRILVRKGLMTSKQLARVVKEQAKRKEQGVEVFLGALCVELGYIKEPDLLAALEEQRALCAPPNNDGDVDVALARLATVADKAKTTSSMLRAVTDDMLRAADTMPMRALVRSRG